MNVEDYLQFDAIGLAALVARREVSAAEVLDAALERMARINATVNAVILDLSAEARIQAAQPLSGPLAGVPYLIKEHGAMVAGTPTMLGSAVFKDNVQPADSALVRALREAGVVIFGKTNVPELSNDAVTESALYGPCRNPWDLDRTTGGSSGGAAAAVCAGIVPAAHATDGGGSIRIPAACTGLFGLKPSRGRVSNAPVNELGGGFGVQHAITRSVRDSALLLDIVSHPQPGDPYCLPPPERTFLSEVGRSPGALRIAFSTCATDGSQIDDECAAAVLDAARLCESLGHHVAEARLPVSFADAGAAGKLINAANIAAILDSEAQRRGRDIDEREIDATTLFAYERGRRLTAPDYVRALRVCNDFTRKAAAFFESYDVLLDSTLGSPAVRIGELRGALTDIPAYAERLAKFMPNTKVANITGRPAMSVPLAWSAAGLPIGVQFMGNVGDEATLLRLAAQLEQARPWAQRRPADL
jgi:amidase